MLNNAYSCVCLELADLQQYTWRNALRITNPSWVERQNEDTDAIILQFAADIGVKLFPWEISCSHRVGVPCSGQNRPILVKFLGYRSRQELYSKRKNLKNHQTLKNAYINGDLTKAINELPFKARECRRAGTIAETFASDGKVFAKRFPGSLIKRIKTIEDLRVVVSQRGYTDTVVRAPPALPVALPEHAGAGTEPAGSGSATVAPVTEATEATAGAGGGGQASQPDQMPASADCVLEASMDVRDSADSGMSDRQYMACSFGSSI